MSRLNQIYINMKRRCYESNFDSYKNYGARGITVCDEWLNKEPSGKNNYSKGFVAFEKWALENGYADNLSIDRINPNGNYEPSNCRWATVKQQANNTRGNHLITYKGETKNLTQWCEELGLNYRLVQMRLRRNWSVEKAFEEKKHLNGWC